MFNTNSSFLDCTPKAVEGRLYSWKKKNISGNTNLNSATSSPVKEPKTPKVPRSSNKKGTPFKKELFEGESDGPEGLVDDKNELLLTPTPARRKRKVIETYEETQSDDDDNVGVYVPKSKIKTEHAEEEEFTIEGLEDEVV